MRVRREGQHAHDLTDLVQLAPLSLAEVLPRVSANTQCSLETSALPPPPPRHQLRLPKPSLGGAQKPAPHIWRGESYLTASSLLFCRMSSMNSWILRLNSRQL